MSFKQAVRWIIYFPVGLFAASAGRQPPHMGGGRFAGEQPLLSGAGSRADDIGRGPDPSHPLTGPINPLFQINNLGPVTATANVAGLQIRRVLTNDPLL